MSRLVVFDNELLMLPVTARVVPSNVMLVWAWAIVDEVPVAVRTRLAAGFRMAENPGPAGPEGPVTVLCGPVGPVTVLCGPVGPVNPAPVGPVDCSHLIVPAVTPVEPVASAESEAKTEELTNAPPPTVAAATTNTFAMNRVALCRTVPDESFI